MSGRLRVAVVGAGWAGLSAAIECASAGAEVSLNEMAPLAGGRARDVPPPPDGLDNGQHICIGAYAETLRLMRKVGVAEADAFVRLPLTLVGPDGAGLRLPRGGPRLGFARAVLANASWRWGERLRLLSVAGGWAARGFACDPGETVAGLAAPLPEAVRRDLIEPLCVAALNTPAEQASGCVFLRVLRDALAAGRGASDLLLPRRGLGALLPLPALNFLERAGVTARLTARVERLERDGAGWQVDDLRVDRVIVAASAVEAARLVEPHDAARAARARALRYEPIATVYLRSHRTRLAEPMLVLRSGPDRPAQFVFDRGRLGGPEGLLAFVVSGAAAWVERGADATVQATLAQAREALGTRLAGPPELVRIVVEKRATFACTPGLDRPPTDVAAGLFAAGDYIAGPYPATLEGSVRSGVAAAAAALR